MRLTYRAVWQVDDLGSDHAARQVRQQLGPPFVSLAIHTALLRMLERRDHPRPEIGAVSVTAQAEDAAPLDPDGPFATPSGQDLLAGFLTDLLAWDAEANATAFTAPMATFGHDGPLPDAVRERARGLLAGLTSEETHQ